MPLKFNFILTIIFSSNLALAQIQKIELGKALSLKNSVDLYNPQLLSENKKIESLSKFKFHEIHLQWQECSKLGESNFDLHKDIQGWVARTWLHCLEEEGLKVNNVTKMEKALAKIEARWSQLVNGAWAEELTERYFDLRMFLAEKHLLAKKYSSALKQTEKLLLEQIVLKSDQQTKLYEKIGDIYQLLNKKDEALYAWQLGFSISKTSALNEKIQKAKGMTLEEAPKSSSELTGDDAEIAKRIDRALAAKDSISAIKDIVELYNHFPGSIITRKYNNKPFELYWALNGLPAQKALTELKKASPSRILSWAETLHQKADYSAALVLLEDLDDKFEGTIDLTKVLWLRGRSAHFVGNYDLALVNFQELIAHHQGSEESLDAYMRSGLVYLRKGDPQAAVSFFDKLLAKGDERYDLNARYWLYRSLLLTKSDRASSVGAELVDKYPLSYYGLKVTSELNKGKVEFRQTKEKAPTLVTDFFVSGDRKNIWNRFTKLAKYGWVGEAQVELSKLVLPDDPVMMVAWAQVLSAHQQYLTAIRLINAATEQAPELRRKEFLQPGFPNAFAGLYKAEADRYQLDAVLLKSLTRQESGFNLSAISRSSAMGLMQMIPGTAKEVAQKMGLKISIPDDMYRPEVNIPMGTYYINQMIEQFNGQIPFALAAYNAGPSRFKLWVNSRTEVQSLLQNPSQDPLSEIWFDEVPWRETSFYVKAILRNSVIYKMMDSGSYEMKANFWQDFAKKKTK